MNRRDFLQILSGSGAALIFDPEFLIWKPGAKKIFLPPTRRLISHASIIEAHMHMYQNVLKDVFKKDDTFYEVIKSGNVTIHGQPVQLFQLIEKK